MSGAGSTKGGDAGASTELGSRKQWQREADWSGTVRVLEWGGLTRTAAQWPRRAMQLSRGTLSLRSAPGSLDILATYNIWNKRLSTFQGGLCITLHIVTLFLLSIESRLHVVYT